MPEHPQADVELRIDPAGPPITGTLQGAGGERPFCGWTELLSLLSAAIDERLSGHAGREDQHRAPGGRPRPAATTTGKKPT